MTELAGEIEQILFEKLPDKRDNAQQCRSILTNLRDEKNKDFKLQIRLGVILPEVLYKMKPTEMASNDKKKEREKIIKDQLEALDLDYQKKRMKLSSAFTCGKCGGNKCHYYQLQTRSSDEPMTTFVTCITCGNRWKFC